MVITEFMHHTFTYASILVVFVTKTLASTIYLFKRKFYAEQSYFECISVPKKKNLTLYPDLFTLQGMKRSYKYFRDWHSRAHVLELFCVMVNSHMQMYTGIHSFVVYTKMVKLFVLAGE